MRRGFLLGLMLLAAAAVVPPARAQPPAATPPFVPGELLVQYKPGKTRAERSAARSRHGLARLDTIAAERRRLDGRGDLELVQAPPGRRLETLRATLARDPDVDFVEPNWIYHHESTADDPYVVDGSLWGMYGAGTTPANSYGSQALHAWAAGKTDCSTVFVGIIDTGVFMAHADLAANAGKVPGESADPAFERDGEDNDGNGYVDDVHGWDFVGNDNGVYDDVHDVHGTHVAGTIGAVGGNGKGVAGVCWSVRLLSAKFLGAGGGTTANAIRAVNYFTDLKRNRGVNIVALNNSWGGGGYSKALANAIAAAGAADILFVAAAGNGGGDGIGDDIDREPAYPASYAQANVITVAALASNGARARFSNYGARSVDLGAPGVGIVSTLPKSGRSPSAYGSMSGTSMATPHVTGAIALYAALHGGSAATIKAAVLDAARAAATPSMSARTVTGGRLDVSGF